MMKRIKQKIRNTRFGKRLIAYLQISLRERLVNWFVHHVIYREKKLKYSVHFTSRVTGSRNLEIGEGVEPYLARSGGLYIQAINGVKIGEKTMIGPGVKIISANHNIREHGKWDKCPPIRIGRHCWIAANAVILPGVELGDDVVVAAGAIVTRSFPSGCVIAGVPAKIIRQMAPNNGQDSPANQGDNDIPLPGRVT